ncbi:MAG: ABC-F family ATP-binding cassette domain-containing protein [Chloroflexi bacterium]|nr:ABC-F family ATP-binding cassette domain-containing protein [Chloroflexota bacterium]
MSILTAQDLGLSFGSFDLFKGISGTVPNDGKIGLIGPNGVGKTSLLLILAGIHAPTTGKVHIARGRRLGYLRQEAVDAFADREHTVYAEMLTVFDGLTTQQARLTALEEAMSRPGQTDAALEGLLEEYGRLQTAFEAAGGYDYELRIQQTLDGLGLGKLYWDMPLNHLSGGQKTRALLARLLLEKPDLLMLDEPTNHLDIEAVEWLERSLREWGGAVLIVSHDRYFLDNVVDTIWEMTPTRLEVYSGNYSAYLLQRQERWEYSQKVFEEEKARLLKEIDFVQRNWVRASTHGRAMGVLRRLSRDLAVIDHFGIEALRSGKQWSDFQISVERPLDMVEAIRQVNALHLTGSRPPAMRPRLASVDGGSAIALRAQGAVIGYPHHALFSIDELDLHRGECAVLIGPNGSGKTTFLKVLLGQLRPLQGRVQVGGSEVRSSLKVGYFAQSHDALNGECTVLEELVARKEMDAAAGRAYLAQYLFQGDDVFKPLDVLSGGERARLALALLALEGANFLVLDEPTNHLDIPARETLQEVLENFSGTVLLVSHDRFLIDRLATQVWDLRDGRLHVFKGPYREYVLRRSRASGAPVQRPVLLHKPMLRDNSKKTKWKAQTLAQLEERIHEQEKTLQRLSAELQKSGARQNYERAHEISWQIAETQARLDELMAEWEKEAV